MTIALADLDEIKSAKIIFDPDVSKYLIMLLIQSGDKYVIHKDIINVIITIFLKLNAFLYKLNNHNLYLINNKQARPDKSQLYLLRFVR